MIYLATALFTAAEQQHGAALTERIEALGHAVYWPWRDAGDAELAAAWGSDWPRINAELARRNLRAIESCAAVIAVAEGADVDAGVAMEIGYAHALGKPVTLLRTDFRTQGTRVGPVNLMLGTTAAAIYTSVEALLGGLAGNTSETVHDFYNLVADEYSDAAHHPTTQAFKQKEEEIVAHLLSGRRFRAALDLGCGDGNFLFNVTADEKTGVDVSVEMIRRHHHRLPAATFLLADCQRPLPLAPAAFDVVHCSFLLDHLADPDACLREMRRLVAADGVVLLALYTPGPFLAQAGDDVLRYRTAAGKTLTVHRSFQPLADLGSKLAALFRVEEQKTVPIGLGDFSLDQYVLRPGAP
ncbi:MAG TPA: nucleoside 2-deoxyribosyltransferase [Thermoanaerobaculia bacterium]|jgi:nucleoside 2-deoxyribosyltransferase|nr:nucleoside 2-deoxyribosyltransferase [Thermoanaerobaculia bacterium]